jgi:tRNA modification GTPase
MTTRVACLTPAGTGAIAVLGIHGSDAWPVIRKLFRPASVQPLPDSPDKPGTVWFGNISDRGVADEAVLTIKQISPATILELHVHGGRQVVEWLLDLLCGSGLAKCTWEELLSSFETCGDADAWAMLARAPTVRTAAVLLDQAHGAFAKSLSEVRAAHAAGRTIEALQKVEELLQWLPLGMHLVEPWRVVVAGLPNVGKSSLVNAIAGFQRSVVAPIPGTTRDVVSTRIAIDGWPVELFDTAGLRAEGDHLEAAGIERARAAVESADLVLWLVDATDVERTSPSRDASRQGAEFLTILNKCDLANPRSTCGEDVRVSAHTGDGVLEILTAISRKLIPNLPAPGTGIPYLPSHGDLLRDLKAALHS